MGKQDTDARPSGEDEQEELTREVRTDRNKVLRFDSYTDDSGPITWFVAYRGKYGWSACRATGEWMDEPSEEDVKHAIRKYDQVELMSRFETPEEVTL